MQQEDEEMPVLVGTLSKRQGINGFIIAEVGHPVFEMKDRYVIYLESITPEKISGHGIPTELKHFKVKIPYYKKTLAPIINFDINTLYNNTPMQTETTAAICAKIQKQPGKAKQPPKFLVCDNPLYGEEIFVRKINGNSFTVRMHDGTVIEGAASPEEIVEVKNFYATYLQFIG